MVWDLAMVQWSAVLAVGPVCVCVWTAVFGCLSQTLFPLPLLSQGLIIVNQGSLVGPKHHQGIVGLAQVQGKQVLGNGVYVF